MARLDLERLRRRWWFAPGALSLGWLVLGAVAGLQAALAAGTTSPWTPRAAAPFLAGLVWIPLTFCVTALARRVPWDRAPLATFVAVHLPAAVATSFVLNAGFSSLQALLGLAAPAEILSVTLRSGIRWLHLNVAGYGAILLVVHLLDHRLVVSGPGSESPVLRVSSGGRRLQLPVDEIGWIEADGDYARVHAAGRSYLLSRRMKSLEAELADTSLIRVHRSAIVNVERVREVRHRSHGDYEAVLVDGTVVRVSRTRRDEILGRMEEGAPSSSS